MNTNNKVVMPYMCWLILALIICTNNKVMAQSESTPCYCNIYLSTMNYNPKKMTTKSMLANSEFIGTVVMPLRECHNKVQNITPSTKDKFASKSTVGFDWNGRQLEFKTEYFERAGVVPLQNDIDDLRKSNFNQLKSLNTFLQNFQSSMNQSLLDFETKMRIELLNGLEEIPNDLLTEEIIMQLKVELQAIIEKEILVALSNNKN